MRYSSKVWVHSKTHAMQNTKPTKDINSWEQWDSKAEYYFYYDVLKPVADKLDLEVIRQYPVTLMVSIYFGKVNWKVDFALKTRTSPSKIAVLIEYKGNWVLQQFANWKKLLLLMETSKMLNHLIVVGSHALKLRLKGITCVEVEDTIQRVGTKWYQQDLEDAIITTWMGKK